MGGWVNVTRGEEVGSYNSISNAFFALGGPSGSIIHNPQGFTP